MRAMRCDICGGYYDHRCENEILVDKEKKTVPINGIVLVSFEDDDNHKHWPCQNGSIDLCPACVQWIIDILKERKKKYYEE